MKYQDIIRDLRDILDPEVVSDLRRAKKIEQYMSRDNFYMVGEDTVMPFDLATVTAGVPDGKPALSVRDDGAD